jgi:putative heme iron utilization protein
MAAIDTIRREVAETRGVMQSARTLIVSLAQRLRDALNAPDVNAEIEALALELDAEQAALSEAIVANNPEVPPAPEEV